MPFTPYHFGPSACIALPLRKYIDIPVFILANVVIDLEPLTVMVFGLNYPLHGYFHTLLGGAAVAVFWALIAYWRKNFFQRLMELFHVSYQTGFGKILLSSLLGVWFHVVVDSILYTDIRPLWPLKTNPAYALLNPQTVYLLCKISFLPAIAFYVVAVASYIKKDKYKKTIQKTT